MPAQCHTNELRFGWGTGAAIVAGMTDDTAILKNPTSRGTIYEPYVGVVDVYKRVAENWTFRVRLTAAVQQKKAYFGTSADIDGTRIAVGAPREDTIWGADSGRVYVFEESAGVWSQTAVITPTGLSPNDYFGAGVALSGDRLAIGCTGDDDAGTDRGSIYVYERQGTTWLQSAKLYVPVPPPGPVIPTGAGAVGFPDAIDIDGDRIVAGMRFASITASQSGAVFVYERVAGSWAPTATLTHSSPIGGTSNDYLGMTIALEGDVVVASAYGEGPLLQGVYPTGAAYVFEHGASGWTETARLVGSDVAPGDGNFGVAMDAGTILLGALHEDGPLPGTSNDYGAIYMFQRGTTGWVQRTKTMHPDPHTYDQFGLWMATGGGRMLVTVGRNRWAAGGGLLSMWTLADLCSETAGVSVTFGGTQTLRLRAPSSFAGEPYFLLGSMSGDVPGIPFAGLTIPLNADPYFLFTIQSPNSPPLSKSFGTLDVNGGSNAFLTLPAASDPALIGRTVHHAFGAFRTPGFQLAYVSNSWSSRLKRY